MRPFRGTMERDLFARLWEEIDFDDHPLSGGHQPEPDGELNVKMTPNSIRLEDARLSFLIGEGSDADSVHRWAANDVRINDGPERLGVHRWSMTPQSVSPELRQWLIQNIGNPEMIEGESVENYRRLLRRLRSQLEPKLPNWTWHLEVDNKADRMGWYVRAPESWCSLFTIFVGLGWNAQIPARGFLLFERAPPGELDRPDEAEANRLDGLRTVALCNGHRGALSLLAKNMEWALEPQPYKLELPGDVELWPPSMGRWPLLHGRSNSIEDTVDWAAIIIDALEPAISTLSATIDGISWQ